MNYENNSETAYKSLHRQLVNSHNQAHLLTLYNIFEINIQKN